MTMQEEINMLRHFVEGISRLKRAAELGLAEEDVRTPDHRKYFFEFHERIIDEARKVLENK